MFNEWLNRFRFLIIPKSKDEIGEELQFHIEQQTKANVAARMTPLEAHRQAVIAFGGVERARQQSHEQRPGHLAETSLQDVRYSLRGFLRNRVFAISFVATIMLGIGVTTAVFSVVDRILFRPLPYANDGRIVSLGLVQPLETQEFLLSGFYYDWRSTQKVFASMTSETASTKECDLTEGTPAQLDCPFVEGNFLPTLGVSPILGRNFLPEEARPGGPSVVLISYALWNRRYNLDPGVLNKSINIDGTPVRVIGVLPRDFEMPRLQSADVLFPLAVDDSADRISNGGFGSPRRVFATLGRGISIQQAENALEPLFQRSKNQIPPEIRSDFHLKVRSLRDCQMQNVRLTAWVLLGAVFAVLLIACANVASLLMARGATRQRELAVRSALGASRATLMRQSLTESLLLSLVGATLGFAFAEGLLRIFIAIAPSNIPYLSKIHLDLRIACFTIALSILCGVFLGFAVAMQKPEVGMLSGRTSTSVSRASIRQWLVVAQIAASMVLLALASLLVRSYQNLERQNLGIRVDKTVTAKVTLGEHSYATPQSQLDFFQRLTTRLRFSPGVSVVSVSDSVPTAENHFSGRFQEIAIEGRPLFPAGAGGIVAKRRVSHEYFQALGIPIVRGEGFRDEDMTSTNHLIILSERLAALLFPNQNPIGQHLRFDRLMASNPWSTIIGVAADVKNSGLVSEDVPEFYLLRRNLPGDWRAGGVWGRTSFVVVRSSLPPEQAELLMRSQIAALDPTLPVDIANPTRRVLQAFQLVSLE
jgi:putative ABC transport system permease protein